MGKYVALLDILGFKEMINNNDHQEIEHLFGNFTVYLQRSLSKNNETIKDQWGRLIFDFKETPINSTIISDSIIFWTNFIDSADFFRLIETLQKFLHFCHNLPFLFLRGGLTYGDFSYINSGVIKGENAISIHPVMVGKALVNAYEMEKDLQIAGCVIDDIAWREAEKNNPVYFKEKWEELVSQKKILKYNMPYKTGPKTNWTINWVSEASNPTQEKLTEGFSALNRDVNAQAVKEKIKNTIDFYNYVKDNLYKAQ